MVSCGTVDDVYPNLIFVSSSSSCRLQKSLPLDVWQGISFAIFCLGDRGYGPEKFCAAGRKLTMRLRQLGAVLYVPPGYGDDGTPGGGVFADLDVWLQTILLPQLRPSTLTLIADSSIHGKDVAPPYCVQVSPNIDTKALEGVGDIEEWQRLCFADSYQNFFQKQCPPSAYQYSMDNTDTTGIQRETAGNVPSQSPPLLGRVIENRRITAADWEQDTRHLRLVVSTTLDSKEDCVNDDPSTDDSELLRERPTVTWNPELLPYRAGDVAAILPSNSRPEVNAFIKVLPLALQAIVDHVLSIKILDESSSRFAGIGYKYWPNKCTLRGWLTYCADIHALPEREDLRALASYCAMTSPVGKSQSEKLVALSEAEHSALYVDYILREKRSWVDVLYDFDSVRDSSSKFTIEVLLGLLNPIRPRLFSIASAPTRDWILRNSPMASNSSTSATTHQNREFSIELCVAVVEGKTRLNRRYHGLCSHYLSGLSRESPSSVVRLWIQPGSFHGLPLTVTPEASNNDRKCIPLLCVGAGTGIAPLRALIQEREAVLSFRQHASSSVCSNVSVQPNESFNRDNVLVFGCRKKDSDFYYKEEWLSLVESHRMMLLTAFSQDQWHKIYVQQVLVSDFGGEHIVRHILDFGGAIYIAGGPKMARAVVDVIVESLCDHFKCEEKDARKILTKMQFRGLFSVEAWS